VCVGTLHKRGHSKRQRDTKIDIERDTSINIYIHRERESERERERRIGRGRYYSTYAFLTQAKLSKSM
jgi:hypothetical protein